MLSHIPCPGAAHFSFHCHYLHEGRILMKSNGSWASIAVKKFRNAKPFEIINDPNLSLFCWWSPCLLLILLLTPSTGTPNRPFLMSEICLSFSQNRQDMKMTSLIPCTMSLLLDVFPVKTAKCPLGCSISCPGGWSNTYIVPKTRPHITAAANFGVETRDGGRWDPRFQRKACSQIEGWRLSHLRRSGYGDPMENGPT